MSTEQTTTRLYLLRDGESTPIRVTDEPAKSWTAELESAVSPDDSNVAYVAATYRANAVGFRQDIRVAPLVGGAPGRVVYEVPAAKFVDSLDWSPDGDRLLLLLIDDGGQGAEVVEVDATTGRQARVLPQNRSASGARYLGGSIAVLEREEGRDSTLVVLRGDGETSRQRLDVENPHQFDAGSCEEVA